MTTPKIGSDSPIYPSEEKKETSQPLPKSAQKADEVEHRALGGVNVNTLKQTPVSRDIFPHIETPKSSVYETIKAALFKKKSPSLSEECPSLNFSKTLSELQKELKLTELQLKTLRHNLSHPGEHPLPIPGEKGNVFTIFSLQSQAADQKENINKIVEKGYAAHHAALLKEIEQQPDLQKKEHLTNLFNVLEQEISHYQHTSSLSEILRSLDGLRNGEPSNLNPSTQKAAEDFICKVRLNEIKDEKESLKHLKKNIPLNNVSAAFYAYKAINRGLKSLKAEETFLATEGVKLDQNISRNYRLISAEYTKAQSPIEASGFDKLINDPDVPKEPNNSYIRPLKDLDDENSLPRTSFQGQFNTILESLLHEIAHEDQLQNLTNQKAELIDKIKNLQLRIETSAPAMKAALESDLVTLETQLSIVDGKIAGLNLGANLSEAIVENETFEPLTEMKELSSIFKRIHTLSDQLGEINDKLSRPLNPLERGELEIDHEYYIKEQEQAYKDLENLQPQSAFETDSDQGWEAYLRQRNSLEISSVQDVFNEVESSNTNPDSMQLEALKDQLMFLNGIEILTSSQGPVRNLISSAITQLNRDLEQVSQTLFPPSFYEANIKKIEEKISIFSESLGQTPTDDEVTKISVLNILLARTNLLLEISRSQEIA